MAKTINQFTQIVDAKRAEGRELRHKQQEEVERKKEELAKMRYEMRRIEFNEAQIHNAQIRALRYSCGQIDQIANAKDLSVEDLDKVMNKITARIEEANKAIKAMQETHDREYEEDEFSIVPKESDGKVEMSGTAPWATGGMIAAGYSAQAASDSAITAGSVPAGMMGDRASFCDCPRCRALREWRDAKASA